MNQKALNTSFHELYLDLTDDDRIAENKRKHDRVKRIEDRKRDTGL